MMTLKILAKCFRRIYFDSPQVLPNSTPVCYHTGMPFRIHMTPHPITFWVTKLKGCFMIPKGSSCRQAYSVMDAHTTGPGFKPWMVRYFIQSFRLTTTISVS